MVRIVVASPNLTQSLLLYPDLGLTMLEQHRWSCVQINNSAYIIYQLLPMICSFGDVLGVFLIAVNTSDDILDSALLYYSQEERRIGELVSLQQDVDYQLFASVHMQVYVHYWSTAIIFKWEDQGETYWTICAAKISMSWDPEISEFFLVAKVLQCIHCVLTVFQTLGGITCPVPMSVTTQGTMRLPHSSNSQVNGLIFSASVLQWSQLPCIVLYHVQLSVLGQQNAYNFGEGMDGRELSLHQVSTKMYIIEQKIGMILIAATIRPDSWDSAGIYDSHAVVLQSRSFVMQWVLVIWCFILSEDALLVAQQLSGFLFIQMTNDTLVVSCCLNPGLGTWLLMLRRRVPHSPSYAD
jgi:hypothetical protein